MKAGQYLGEWPLCHVSRVKTNKHRFDCFAKLLVDKVPFILHFNLNFRNPTTFVSYQSQQLPIRIESQIYLNYDISSDGCQQVQATFTCLRVNAFAGCRSRCKAIPHTVNWTSLRIKCFHSSACSSVNWAINKMILSWKWNTCLCQDCTSHLTAQKLNKIHFEDKSSRGKSRSICSEKHISRLAWDARSTPKILNSWPPLLHVPSAVSAPCLAAKIYQDLFFFTKAGTLKDWCHRLPIWEDLVHTSMSGIVLKAANEAGTIFLDVQHNFNGANTAMTNPSPVTFLLWRKRHSFPRTATDQVIQQ